MRISDWSSDVCSSDLIWWLALAGLPVFQQSLPESPEEPAVLAIAAGHVSLRAPCYRLVCPDAEWLEPTAYTTLWKPRVPGTVPRLRPARPSPLRSEEHTSELQSLMRISYAVFCLKKKKILKPTNN